ERIKVGDVVLSYTGAGQRTTGDAKSASAEKPVKDVAAVVAGGSAKNVQDGTGMRPATRRNDVGAAMPLRSTRAAPSVRLLARKLGIELGQIQGSGPDGRVLVEDLNRLLTPVQAAPKSPGTKPQPDYGTPGSRIKVQGLRRLIAENMVRS